MKRLAVVVGVNETENLTVLKSAVSGAKQVGKWLKGEGFDVHCYTDDQGPVTAGTISDEVLKLINRPIWDQMVMYFSGHGLWKNETEYWLLSGAPSNPNDAIVVSQCIQLAFECGIPNVVFISDACRSVPSSLQENRVNGTIIFPNRGTREAGEWKVDRFFACLPGKSAYEIVADNEPISVFTHCFLQAYHNPDPTMIREVKQRSGEILYVVPNKKLEEYLKQEVNELLAKKNILKEQLPTSIVMSEKKYIGRVMVNGEPMKKVFRAGIAVPEKAPRESFVVEDVAQVALARTIGSSLSVPKSVVDAIDGASGQSDFDTSMRLVETAQVQGRRHFETSTGFNVVGTSVSDVFGINMKAELLSDSDATQPAFVRLYPGCKGISNRRIENASSVVLRFAKGSGAVLAGLENYIGTVVVEDGRVVNVSYAPSDNSPLWQDYMDEHERLEGFRATAAAAARYGVFRVNRGNAGAIAQKIRYLKRVDPTLGLYAAYAYADVDMRDKIRSILFFMNNDLSAMLFDVAMLADEFGRLHVREQYPIVPFCPMLSQGWPLLRVKIEAEVPPFAEEAADHLLGALWTTFDTVGMDILIRAINERRVS